MKARTILIGCAVIVVVFGGLVVIGCFVAINRMSAPVPLQEPAALLHAGSAGIAVMHLEPDDPFVGALVRSVPDLEEATTNVDDLLPMHLVWTVQRGLEEAEGHTLRLSIEPKGRLIGMFLDFALWQISGDEQVSREEYNNEGITSFPETTFPGFFFVRGNTIVWSSDIETARFAVDGVDPEGINESNLKRLLPPAGKHTLYGVFGNLDGSLIRVLGSIPGEAFDIEPAEADALEAVAFTFDSQDEESLSGDIFLHFDPATDISTQRDTTDRFAARLVSLSRGDLVVTVEEPSYDEDRVRLPVTVAGLSELRKIFREASDKALEVIESLDQGAIKVEP